MKRPWYKGFLPGWIVSGSGGGLSSVTTNPTLTGAGTGGSPLGVTGWPLAYYSFILARSNTFGITANQVTVYGFALPHALTFSNICVWIGTADAVNSYDFGIYSFTGSLLAHIGAQTLPSTAFQAFGVVGGAKTIQAGLYAFAFTGTAATANISGAAITGQIFYNGSYAASVGGVLPASVTAFTISTANMSSSIAGSFILF